MQGDRANGMYFVESGTLVVLKKMGGDAGDEKAVNEVGVIFQKLVSQTLKRSGETRRVLWRAGACEPCPQVTKYDLS